MTETVDNVFDVLKRLALDPPQIPDIHCNFPTQTKQRVYGMNVMFTK